MTPQCATTAKVHAFSIRKVLLGRLVAASTMSTYSRRLRSLLAEVSHGKAKNLSFSPCRKRSLLAGKRLLYLWPSFDSDSVTSHHQPPRVSSSRLDSHRRDLTHDDLLNICHTFVCDVLLQLLLYFHLLGP